MKKTNNIVLGIGKCHGVDGKYHSVAEIVVPPESLRHGREGKEKPVEKSQLSFRNFPDSNRFVIGKEKQKIAVALDPPRTLLSRVGITNEEPGVRFPGEESSYSLASPEAVRRLQETIG